MIEGGVALVRSDGQIAWVTFGVGETAGDCAVDGRAADRDFATVAGAIAALDFHLAGVADRYCATHDVVFTEDGLAAEGDFEAHGGVGAAFDLVLIHAALGHGSAFGRWLSGACPHRPPRNPREP